MAQYRKFVQDIGILGVSNFIVSLRGLILLPILTKFLGPEKYGIWIQLSITLTLLTPFIVLGLPDAIVRFLASEQQKEKMREIVWSILSVIAGFGIFIALLFFLLAEPIANFLQTPALFIKILGFIIIFESLNIALLNIFRALQQIKKYSFFLLLSVISEVGLISLSIFLGFELLGALVSLLFVKIVLLVLLTSTILIQIGIQIPRFSSLKEHLRFGLPITIGSGAFWGVQSSDRYLIAIFLGILFVGYYAPAYALGNILHLFILPFALLLPPVLSKLFEEQNISEIQIYLKYSLKYFLLIAIPAVFGLSILSKELLTLFSTNEIASQSHAVIPFVAISLLLYGVYTIFFQVLFLFKQTKISGILWIGAALLNIGLNIVLIPLLGILGAALTTLVAYVFTTAAVWYYSSRHLVFPIDWRALSKTILASIAMGVVIWNFHVSATIIDVTAAIGVGILVYGILLLLFKTFSKQEIDLFKRTILSH